MKEKQKEFIKWIKEHKRELIIAGVSTATIVLIIWTIKEHSNVERGRKYLKHVIEDNVKGKTSTSVFSEAELSKVVSRGGEMACAPIEKVPHSVRRHIRTLPEGWHPSKEKVATAAKHGYVLKPGETWVKAYTTKGMHVAA